MACSESIRGITAPALILKFVSPNLIGGSSLPAKSDADA
jgi:hypothetical protein